MAKMSLMLTGVRRMSFELEQLQEAAENKDHAGDTFLGGLWFKETMYSGNDIIRPGFPE